MNNNSLLENAWKTVITVGCVSMAALVTISRYIEFLPLISSKLAELIMFLTCVQKVPVSDPNLDIDYPD
jgi:hypothetical protein